MHPAGGTGFSGWPGTLPWFRYHPLWQLPQQECVSPGFGELGYPLLKCIPQAYTCEKDIFRWPFITAPFVIPKNWKPPNCPSYCTSIQWISLHFHRLRKPPIDGYGLTSSTFYILLGTKSCLYYASFCILKNVTIKDVYSYTFKK